MSDPSTVIPLPVGTMINVDDPTTMKDGSTFHSWTQLMALAVRITGDRVEALDAEGRWHHLDPDTGDAYAAHLRPPRDIIPLPAGLLTFGGWSVLAVRAADHPYNGPEIELLTVSGWDRVDYPYDDLDDLVNPDGLEDAQRYWRKIDAERKAAIEAAADKAVL